MTDASSENGLAVNYLEFGKYPDISFIFPNYGGALILAEKYKLVERSDMFKKQFANSQDLAERIAITDISFNTFGQMMEHIIFGTLEVNKDNYADLLYAARKYFLDSLTSEIIKFLRGYLNDTNLHEHFDFLEKFEIKMINDVMKDICKKSPLVIIGKATAPYKNILKMILESEALSCSEFELYKAVVAMLKKHQPKEINDVNNIRKALGNLIYLIRFPSMTVVELVSCGEKPSLLTPEELIDLQQWVQNKTFSNTLQFFSGLLRYKADGTTTCRHCGYRC